MIFSASTSRWQTVIADLSLILFLVAASALEESPDVAEHDIAEQQENAQQGQQGQQGQQELVTPEDIALTVWSDAPGGLPLADWLAQQPDDDSQRLSITVTYREGGLETAMQRAALLQMQAGPAGSNARILLMTAEREMAQVRLVQDDPAAQTGPNIAY